MAKYARLLLVLFAMVLFTTDQAYASYSALRCQNGQPVVGTTLYDQSSTGACEFTGVQHIFSTIICQFVTMINTIMDKFFCSIQQAVQPVITLVIVVFVMMYGVQVLIGKAQLSAGEAVTRVIKMSLVLWLISDNSFGVSAAISYLFGFFIDFISETTRWIVNVLNNRLLAPNGISLNITGTYNPGITATFAFLDEWVYNSLTGSLSDANAKVIGFFIAMGFVMPGILMMFAYWWISVMKMLVSTLIAFLMSVVAIAFLLGLSPIFISFILFQSTFQFFDQWVRFMASFAIQVMVSFAILTMWLYSLTFFAPFFNELSEMIYPYERVVRTSGSTYVPFKTWGLCPMEVYTDPNPRAKCINPAFNPIGPVDNTDEGNQDYRDIIPPTKVPELNYFLFYIFYNMISLIIVSYGFASLQKKSGEIAKQLAGPSYAPMLNSPSLGSTSFEGFSKAGGESEHFMSKNLYTAYNRRHESGKTWYEQMKSSFGSLAGGR